MNITPRIDYQKLSLAQSFYAEHGFTEVAVPWLVSRECYEATVPDDRKHLSALACPLGHLNASGEQSFLQLLLNGVPLTRNFCITPCFRPEPILDELHHIGFVKLELIDTNVSSESLESMIGCAQLFLNRFTPEGTTRIQTNTLGDAFDLVDTRFHIELGSYGIRTYKHLTWVYGTGLALPRLDTVRERY